MKIITKRGQKDYYDYMQGLKGIDPLVTYDRRDATVVSESPVHFFDWPYGYDLYFSKKPFKCDSHKVKKSIWQSCKYKNTKDRYVRGWKRTSEDGYEGTIYHLLLEIGYKHFIFEIERYLDDNDKLQLDVSIADIFTVDKSKKVSKSPLYLCKWSNSYSRHGNESDGIDNPILRDTWIPSFIPAEDMWNMLYEYISSLNDKDFVDTRTNEQHIESHGFDKKISFRHRK